MNRLAVGAAVVAAAALGASHVVEKAAVTRGVAPEALAAGRGLGALLLVFAPWVAGFALSRVEWPARRDLVRIAVIGTVASGVVILMSILALVTTSATHKGVVQALYPLGTAVFAAALLGERIGARGWAVFGVMTVGLAVLMTDGLDGMPRSGDWLLLATVPLIGFCDAWSKRALAAVDPLTLAAGRQLFGLAFLAAALPLVDGGALASIGAAWPWVLAAGVLAGIFALAFYVAIDRGAVSLAAGLLALAPVLTALLEWRLLGDAPGPWQQAGLAVVVLASLALARMRA